MSTTATAPFVRQFGPGATGTDVRAVKRALIAAGHGHGVDGSTTSFGTGAQAQLVAFKKMCKLDADPVYTKQTQHFLAPYFDARDVTLLIDEQHTVARQAFCAVAALTVAHVALFAYTEKLGDDPGERGWWRCAPLKWDGTVEFSSDCSQHWIGCGHHAGLKHPIFQTDAATGAILGLPRTTAAAAKPGDGVVFVGPKAPNGHHITLLYEKLPNAGSLTGADWKVVNMGGHGEPVFSTLSAQASYQAREGYSELVYVELPL